jgi:hypothetical protein
MKMPLGRQLFGGEFFHHGFCGGNRILFCIHKISLSFFISLYHKEKDNFCLISNIFLKNVLIIAIFRDKIIKKRGEQNGCKHPAR